MQTHAPRAAFAFLTAFLASLLAAGNAAGQFQIDQPPIDYARAPHRDPAANLQQRLEQGKAKLEHDSERGYLVALLRELGISEKSQTLVFSKTSFQRNKISPQRPRAIYFSDDSYVGFVQDGDVLEIASVDPRLGAIFYSLDQAKTDRPALVRQTDDCLQCHASSMTQGVPGQLVRSVFPNISGNPVLTAGSFRTTWQSPLRERWGGWYVTGAHGRQRHMGNTTLRGGEPEKFDREKGANVTDLRSRFDPAPYLTPHSDIVALMVLEHQGPAHNQLTLAGYQALLARRDQEALNQMDGKPPSAPVESIQRRYQGIGEDVLRCLLLAGETPLTDPVRGVSGFAEHFASLGPGDAQGRSLRQLDLQKRLFKHPCSYLIYGEAFNALLEPVKTHIYRRLGEVLAGKDRSGEFSRLTAEDRRAIYEILRETKPDLADQWRREAVRPEP